MDFRKVDLLMLIIKVILAIAVILIGLMSFAFRLTGFSATKFADCLSSLADVILDLES